MRRESDVSVLDCPISPRERLVCDELKAATGLETDSDLVRTGLYHWAVFVLGPAEVDTETFRLRGAGKRPAATAQRRRRAQRS